ncbi:TetR/AcrR family transcriptional regulator [Shewanella livingstonensis]|uniref:TetR/AcrR family transcriptional regulator n=1 Tax=Shewanella livingstonensis TaxID=150120 RepID=A0A3G8LXA2_9GAMM|nr:TetR/AcrR family transcriptional regulator [Shewanella livingstonensis]AZG74117.1 TetR/AcrR family transcriptional regulator [Shewanella livingstonensis]
MAKKNFEREDVLDKVITLFWQNGYAASSIQQITKATGLKPGSLYYEFESKEGLFQAALERYATFSIDAIHQSMANAPSVNQAIKQILNDLIEQSKSCEYCGCFLIKTQLELASQGNKLYQFASAQLAQIEQIYVTYLSKSVTEAQAKAYAAQLMTVIFGIRIYGYQADSAETSANTVTALLPWLTTIVEG